MSLEMKYFVLKPRGSDPYAVASREAMRAYSNSIRKFDIELSESLYDLVMYKQRMVEAPMMVEVPK